jgi:hypothetical protein
MYNEKPALRAGLSKVERLIVRGRRAHQVRGVMAQRDDIAALGSGGERYARDTASS